MKKFNIQFTVEYKSDYFTLKGVQVNTYCQSLDYEYSNSIIR